MKLILFVGDPNKGLKVMVGWLLVAESLPENKCYNIVINGGKNNEQLMM